MQTMSDAILDLGWDTVRLSADWSQASSPILYHNGDEWVSTPFRVADASHQPGHAFALVLRWFDGQDAYLGADDDPDELAGDWEWVEDDANKDED